MLGTSWESTPNSLARPFQTAWASAVPFTVGAAVPLLAIALTPSGVRVVTAIGITLVALGGLGVVGARLGGAPVGRAALRVVLGGAFCAGHHDGNRSTRGYGYSEGRGVEQTIEAARVVCTSMSNADVTTANDVIRTVLSQTTPRGVCCSFGKGPRQAMAWTCGGDRGSMPELRRPCEPAALNQWPIVQSPGSRLRVCPIVKANAGQLDVVLSPASTPSPRGSGSDHPPR